VHLASPLGDPFVPFSPVLSIAGADADVATVYSAASLMSVSPHPLMANVACAITRHLSVLSSPPHSPPNNGRLVSPTHSSFPLSTSAPGTGTGGTGNGGAGTGVAGRSSIGPHHAAFESREVVAGAQSLLPAPDFVLVGGPGLVRAALLRNRVHALTVDTVGVVVVWDIVRAVCIGQFLREDVLLAANANNNRGSGGGGNAGGGGSIASRHEDEGPSVCDPREGLDIVRECIDGEAFVVP
jgi:WD repeat-containing protein 48